MSVPDPAPPRRPFQPPFDGDPGPAAWVGSLCDYLTLRNTRVDVQDPSDLLEWLRLQHLRDQVPDGRGDRRRRADPFGLQHPPQTRWLHWSAPLQTAAGQALGTARIEATGREALVMALPFDLRPDHQYCIQLQTGTKQYAELVLLPIWQARTHVNRWRIGAVVLDVVSSSPEETPL